MNIANFSITRLPHPQSRRKIGNHSIHTIITFSSSVKNNSNRVIIKKRYAPYKDKGDYELRRYHLVNQTTY
jgi:hypothetical protein